MAEYHLQYVGYDEFETRETRELFSRETIDTISDKVTELLAGVHPEGKKIVVPEEAIVHVISRIHDNNFGPAKDIIDNVIGVIVSQIRDEFETIEKNNKLSVWVRQYGSNGNPNEFGLMAHPPIKVKKRRPAPMQFNMNY